MVIPVAHDYICPWCWIALSQTERLKKEFGITFDWLSYELMPENLPWGDPQPRPEEPANKPATPSRLTLAYAAENMPIPTTPRPPKMRSHNALQATEFVKHHGDPDLFITRMYRALWEEGQEINNPEVIEQLAQGTVESIPNLLKAIETKAYDDKIVKFDDDAYAVGVYNVPTYFIGDQRYAEQPTVALITAIQKELALIK